MPAMAADNSASAPSSALPAESDSDDDACQADLQLPQSSAPAQHALASPAAVEQAKRAVFAQLQPLCSQLLQHRAAPKQLASCLETLAAALQQVDSLGLQGCTDYVLFPLLFIVDSVALTHQPPGARRPPAAGDQTSPQGEAAIPIPAAKSDRVAERVLQCIEVVVRRCTMDSGDQMIQLLERIAVVAGLPVDRAAEEVRHRAIQCLNSLLSNMGPSQLGGPITALQDPKHTPMVGYLAHLMLSAAEQEAKVGHTGSKALRATALQALRRLIVAVGTADGLAFVLPGIASGLAKAMMTAGTSHGTRARSGAAAGSAAAAEAVKGMVALLTITLGDRACRPILAPAGESEDPEAAALWPLDSLDSTLRSTEATLEAMRKLAVKHAKARGGAESGVDEEETTPTLPSKPQPNCAARAGPETMVVVRDEAWVKQGAQRIHNLLTQALPLLCSHPRPAVRAAVAQGAVELLAQCSLALQQSTELLLEIIFTLAQDEWPQVATPCQQWLQRRAPALPSPTNAQVPEDAVKAVTVRLIAGLVRALKTGEEVGTLHARRLTSALQALPPDQLSAAVLGHPVQRGALCGVLCQAFAFERAGASLLLHATAEGGTYGALQLPQPATDAHVQAPVESAAPQPGSNIRTSETAEPTSDSMPGPAATGQSSGRDVAAGQTSSLPAAPAAALRVGQGGQLVAVLLPRQPVSLQLIASSRCYEAVASVARSAGQAASQAGGSALRGLIDHLLGDLEKTLPKGDASSAAGGLGSGSTGGWQCSAAAVVAVISEVLYGASPAWAQSQARQQAQRRQAQQATQHAQQAHGLTAQHAQQQADQGAQPNGDAQKDQQRQQQLQTLEGVVGLVMDALTVETLWGVPTHLDMATDAANPPTPQVLGENALLMRVLLETVGVAARAIGLRFTANGRILRTVLLPVLERMGDPSPFVAAAAATAVGSICMHCGYASLQGLVAANADYIVDGVCRQLRHLDEYPRAPHLFAALLRKAGVAPSLLPLLAEPARAAFQGLSILARRKRPRHTAAFLQALVEIVSGAAADADDVLAAAKALAGHVEASYTQRKRARHAASHAAPPEHADHAAAAATVNERDRTATASTSTLAGSSAPANGAATRQQQVSASSNAQRAQRTQRTASEDAAHEALPEHVDMAEIGEYFTKRLQQQQAEPKRGLQVEEHDSAAGDSSPAGSDSDDEPNAEPCSAARRGGSAKVALSEEQWMGMADWRSRVHAAAVLASAAADVTGPLLTSSDLKVMLLAVDVAVGGLRALQATTAFTQLEEYHIAPYVVKPDKIEPVPPETPALLPSVHALWGPLIAALKDSRVAAVEKALATLAELAELAGGDFLARRTQLEAWPVLARLLKYGPSQQRASLEAGQDDGKLAPAVVQRVRHAVLSCLASMAGSSAARAAVQGLASPMVEAAAMYLGGNELPAVKEAASQVLLAVASFDPDAVWLVLTQLVNHDGRKQPMNPNPKLFPAISYGRPGSAYISSKHAAEAAQRAESLLAQVEKMRPAWHDKCAAGMAEADA